MTATPVSTFSVLIPAYQAAAFVGHAIESALAQDPPPLEVIVCDDGSTDATLAVLEGYRPSITVLAKPNGGEASARNALFRAAQGDFVVYLDADDIYLPGRLAALHELITRDPAIDLATTDAFMVLDGEIVGRRYEGEQVFALTDQRKAIIRANFIFGHAAVRRSLLHELGGFDESILYATDWEMWVRVILGGGRAALVPEPLAEYRLHASAMSVQRLRMSDGRISTLGKTLKRGDLDDAEREIIETALARERVRNERELFFAGLRTRSTGSRQRAWRVARNTAQPRRKRLLAALGAVSPRAAGLAFGRRDKHVVWGPGDRPIPHASAPRSRA